MRKISEVGRLAALIPVLLVPVLLAGCVSVQQQSTNVSPPGQSRPVIAVVPPRPAVAPAAQGPRVVNKIVAAGTSTILNTATSINPDCSLIALPTARVTQEPVHGMVQLHPFDTFTSYPPTDPRAACAKVKVPGIAAEYRPAPGFVGSDFTAIEYIFKDGRQAELRFAITVK